MSHKDLYKTIENLKMKPEWFSLNQASSRITVPLFPGRAGTASGCPQQGVVDVPPLQADKLENTAAQVMEELHGDTRLIVSCKSPQISRAGSLETYTPTLTTAKYSCAYYLPSTSRSTSTYVRGFGASSLKSRPFKISNSVSNKVCLETL